MALTADEVEQLRRLHVLAEFGSLPAPMQALFDELRARDTSVEIIAPIVDVQYIPQQRTRDDALDNLLNLVELETNLDTGEYDDGSFDFDEESLQFSSIRFVSDMFKL